MKFRLLLSSSWTVKFADKAESGWRFDTSKGVWWLRLGHIEQLISESICAESFGESIDTYVFGLEISDSSELIGFEATKKYVSYRPKAKLIISVGQIDWTAVRFLSPIEQLDIFKQSLLDSISRASVMKRKPSGFDFEIFHHTVTRELARLDDQDCMALLDRA